MTTDLPPAVPNDRPHRPADDSEEIYYQGSPMLRGELSSLFICWAIAVVLFAAPILFRVFETYWPLVWITLACIVVGVIVALIPVLTVRRIRYRISNYRIDWETGLLSKNIDTLELWHVEDIRFHQSLIDRILGVGTITVISHDDTTPQMTMRGIPNPRPVFEALKQRIIAVKRQRGVLKVDSGS